MTDNLYDNDGVEKLQQTALEGEVLVCGDTCGHATEFKKTSISLEIDIDSMLLVLVLFSHMILFC